MLLRQESKELLRGRDFDGACKRSKGRPDTTGRNAIRAFPIFAGGSAAQTESLLVGQGHIAMPWAAGEVIAWQ